VRAQVIGGTGVGEVVKCANGGVGAHTLLTMHRDVIGLFLTRSCV
jgi:hypothetical protein